MGVERPGLPFSPTAIGMATGMDVPGGPPEAEGRSGGTAGARTADLTDVIPGQSGAEALAALPDDRPGKS